MIKVKTFSNYLYPDVDMELEKFISEEGIKRGDIILLKPYTALNPEDNFLYHYIKLVYEVLTDDEILGGIQESEY